MYIFGAFTRLINSPSDTHAILDKEGRIMVVLVGRPPEKPGTKPWCQVAEDAALQMGEARAAAGIRATPHRRGRFAVVATGVSLGGGQRACLPAMSTPI